MKIRAVIFDIYGTLLEIGSPPSDAGMRWQSLWQEMLGMPPRLSLAEFAAATETIIAREHAAARRAGVSFPEIFWPAVAIEALPELTQLAVGARDDFLYRHTQLLRTARLMPAAAGPLELLHSSGTLLGIASNAQPYTLRELEMALGTAGLSSALFTPALCFHSFAHGFSKPDPHVFRLLTIRLRALDVAPGETLMVGDRFDNDIEPARAQGWRTWCLKSDVSGVTSGSWTMLRRWLEPLI